MYAALRDAGYQRHEAIVYVNDGLESFTQWRDNKKQFLTANRARAIDAHLTMGTYTDMPTALTKIKLAPVKRGKRKFHLE
jgi:hypothetical protein